MQQDLTGATKYSLQFESLLGVNFVTK